VAFDQGRLAAAFGLWAIGAAVAQEPLT
jgi:hypothetical protein